MEAAFSERLKQLTNDSYFEQHYIFRSIDSYLSEEEYAETSKKLEELYDELNENFRTLADMDRLEYLQVNIKINLESYLNKLEEKFEKEREKLEQGGYENESKEFIKDKTARNHIQKAQIKHSNNLLELINSYRYTAPPTNDSQNRLNTPQPDLDGLEVEGNEIKFSVPQWCAIFYYAKIKNLLPETISKKEKFEAFLLKHNNFTTFSNFKNNYYKSRKNINKCNYPTDKLEAIIPFMAEHYNETVSSIENDIEHINEDLRQRYQNDY